MPVQRDIWMEPGKIKRADRPTFTWVQAAYTVLMSKEGSAKLSGSFGVKLNQQRRLYLLEQHALVSLPRSVIVGEQPRGGKIQMDSRGQELRPWDNCFPV